MASDQYVSVKAFADLQGVEERTVRNWMRYDPPLPFRVGKKGQQIPMRRGNKWRIEFELKRQTAERAPSEGAAKKRLEEIKVEREEIALRKDKEELMLSHVYRARVAKLTSHFAGVVKGQLPQYTNDVQLAESPTDARAILKRIEDDLLDGLRRTAETIDEDPDPDDVADGNPGAAGAAA